MKKQKKNFKEWLENSIFYCGDFYVKLSFTILFIVIFIISFFAFNGYKYLFSVEYADNLRGYNFQIHTIDVEQGDCFLIRLPQKKCMLIDTGEEKYSNRVHEYINQFFISEGISQIDYFVLTHPDSDHIGGAKSIIDKFKVKSLLRPPIYSLFEKETGKDSLNLDVDESIIYNQTIKEGYDKGINIEFFEKGKTINLGGCKLEFLSPKLQKYSSSNDYSAVMMFSQQTKKFLFMGDAEKEIEKTIIKEYGDYLKADLLKVGHHGSNTSTSQELLDIVNPQIAVISCSGSSTLFPHNDVINRLENKEVNIITTAEKGNFVLGIRNDKLIFAVAERSTNLLALLLCIILTIVIIIWENPFKRRKTFILQKKT